MEVQVTLDIQGAYDATGFYLSECARKNNYLIPQDFTFIKMRLASFAFYDMSFRYKNQFFAILLDIRHNNSSIFEDISERKGRLIKFCQDNNLIPCLFPLNMSFVQENGKYGYGTYLGGRHTSKQAFSPQNRDNWNLIHAVTNTPINPSALATDEPIEMSEYEQYNFATEIAKQIVAKEHGDIVEWNDVLPSNSPQLTYINRNHSVEEWCCVRVVDKPIEELTTSEIQEATKDTHIFTPIFSHNGLFFLIYIQNKNRTDFVHNYQYKVKEAFRTLYEIIN